MEHRRRAAVLCGGDTIGSASSTECPYRDSEVAARRWAARTGGNTRALSTTAPIIGAAGRSPRTADQGAGGGEGSVGRGSFRRLGSLIFLVSLTPTRRTVRVTFICIWPKLTKESKEPRRAAGCCPNVGTSQPSAPPGNPAPSQPSAPHPTIKPQCAPPSSPPSPPSSFSSAPLDFSFFLSSAISFNSRSYILLFILG